MRLPKGLSIVPIKSLTVARLYNTNIVQIDHANNVITLQNGGWNTNHTKKCINLVMQNYDFNLYQKNYEWFVVFQGETIPFEDGMQIEMKEVA